MLIWISGPTGSGKTSLCELLSNLGYKIAREKLPKDIFSAFRIAPAKHCAELQFEIMRTRNEQWNTFRNDDKIAFDRSTSEDYEVFCRLHYKNGLLSDSQYEAIGRYRTHIEKAMPRPDLIVYMNAALDKLESRLLSSGQPDEIIAGIHWQAKFYNEWIENQKESVLKIDNSQCSLPVIQRLFKGG